MFASYSCDFMICWPIRPSSNGRNSSIRRPNNNPIELEFNIATWPLLDPHQSESIGKERSDYVG